MFGVMVGYVWIDDFFGILIVVVVGGGVFVVVEELVEYYDEGVMCGVY